MIKQLQSLKYSAETYGVEPIASIVLNDPRFSTWSCASFDKAHHYGDGGLLQHTWEVIHFAIHNKNAVDQNSLEGWMRPETGDNLPSGKEIYLAGLFHDYGKIWDYERVIDQETKLPKWIGTDHKRKIHHINRSASEWTRAVERTGMCSDIHDSVLHAILSHHGLPQWGSPVGPNTRLAWLIHLADQISARMYDCDTIESGKKHK